MKTLNKRIFRGIGKNASFYVSSIILTAMAVMLFMAEICAAHTIGSVYLKFMDEANAEDAEFTVFDQISDDEMEEISAKYDLTVEKQHYMDYETEENTIRVFEQTEKLNRYSVTEGKDISADSDILLSYNFAEANGILIGDTISVFNKDYNVCGFCERPDYLYMLRNSGDLFHSNEEFGLAVIKSDELESAGSPNEFYAVKYDDNENIDNIIDFRTILNEKYTTLSYTSSDNNVRISMVRQLEDSSYQAAYSMVAMICIIVMIIISLILGRIVVKESKQIGTLSAFGYRNGEIKRHYMLYGAIPALIGSVVGLIFTAIAVKPLIRYSTSQLEYLDYSVSIDVTALVISILIPLVLYSITAYCSAGKMLRKNETVELLSNRYDENKKHSAGILANSKASIPTRFRVRVPLANKKRSVIVFVGMLMGCMTIVFGFSMSDTADDFAEHGFDSMGDFQYQYFLSEPLFSDTDPVEEGEAMNAFAFELKDVNRLVTFYGVNKESKLFNTEIKDGGTFNEDEYYITAIAAKVLQVNVGDTMSFYNPMSLEEVDVKISGIVNNNVTIGIYTGMKNICSLAGIENDSFYNIILSEKKLSNEDDIAFSTTVTKDSLKKQMKEITAAIGGIINMMKVFGAVICIIFVYICINQIINENLLNISMFKVLGYKDKEINSMVLTPYHIFVPITAVLGILMGKSGSQTMWDRYAVTYNFQAEAMINLNSIIISAAVFAASYVISLMLLRRKVLNADMVEVLKDNRE